jgi:integrase
MAYLKAYFYLKKSRSRNGKAPIYCRVLIGKKRKEFSVKRYIELRYWDDTKQMPKERVPEVKQTYDYLKSVEHSLFDAELNCIKNKTTFTIDDVLNIHNGIDKNFKGIVELFEIHQTKFNELVQAQQRTQASWRKYQNCLNHLLKFIKRNYKLSDIDVRSLDMDFISEFDHYLRTKGKCSNNTTVKYLQAFKKIVKVAIKKGFIDRDPFMDYTAKLNDVDRDYLTDAELKRLHETVLPRESLVLARDAFLLACYTGLAYSDLKMLKKNQIIEEHGDLWIKTFRTKSKVKAEIMLLTPALRLIDKYKDNPVSSIKGLVIPIVSNQKVNNHLKEIAKLCQIEKTLVFHLARHTFATTVTLAKGISIEVVSKMLGHKNVKQTQHYAKLVNTRIQDEMKAIKGYYL